MGTFKRCASHLLLAVLLILTISARAQSYALVGTRIAPFPLYLSMGYAHVFQGFPVSIDIEGKVPLDNKVATPTHATFSLGYRLSNPEEGEDPSISLTPLVNYSYTHHSNDHKELDSWGVGGGFRVTYNLFYVMPAIVDKQFYIGAGIIAKL